MLMQVQESDDAMVEALQRAAFDYFIRYTNPENGLVADTSIEGVPCSIAAVGFALSSYCVAAERGWMAREAAAERVATALAFFAEAHQGQERHATGYRGFFYHFLDMATGRRAWNSELSTIDTALLVAGMLTAANYFTGPSAIEEEIREHAAFIYERIDWRWALNKGETLSMGWKPGSGFLRWRYQGYDEAHILYLLALASPSHPIPASSYDAFTRSYAWMRVEDRDFLYAGPLFIHLFSQAYIDFRGLRDRPMSERNSDYIANTKLAIEVQRGYAERNPHGFKGYSREIWGLSACDGPPPMRRRHGDKRPRFMGYAARGAPMGPDDGTLAPWAPLACLPYDRAAALSGTKAMLKAYPGILLDGRFVGGFNPSMETGRPEGWLDDRSVGIDQGLLVMSIENARSDFVWTVNRACPILRRGLERAGFSGGWLDAAPSA